MTFNPARSIQPTIPDDKNIQALETIDIASTMVQNP